MIKKEDAKRLVELINDLELKGLKARYKSEDYFGKRLRLIVVTTFGKEMVFYEAMDCIRFLRNIDALDIENDVLFRLNVE